MLFKISERVENFLNHAVTPNGSNAWDPQVKYPDKFYRAIASQGMLGLGDAYVEGLWECEDLAGFFYRAVRAGLLEALASALPMRLMRLKFALTNPQNMLKAKRNAYAHYSRGNELFEAMLDPRLTYSCALWKNPIDLDDDETLDDAQNRKLDLICRKLKLERRTKVLELGCGWGSLAGYAAEKYAANVMGITPVQEQVEYAANRYRYLPVKIAQADYREMSDASSKFDCVVSVGMFEHVGKKNRKAYMDTVNRCLFRDGISLIHCFGRSDPGVPLVDTWTERYIFPGGYLPTIAEIAAAAEEHFNIVDLQELGRHYDKTLIHWCRNFEAAWNSLRNEYDERFRRMWRYYLLSAAGVFRARKLQLWQIVLVKKGSELLYEPVR
ncbi:MAG: cyclopropane fatty acyl phospholipid synthase [bacterium]|nr:cyclopropane fatty acyl phospholipid synthase [bacterium]